MRGLSPQSVLFNLAAAGYLVGSCLYLLSIVLRRAGLGRLGAVAMGIALAAQTAGLALRAIEMKTLPVTNTYETLVFYGWVFVLGYMVMGLVGKGERKQIRVVGMLVGFLASATLFLASSPLYTAGARPLVPALQSHWLILHVSLAILGEGFFAVAFFSSLLFLLLERRLRRRGEPASTALERLDQLSYRAVAIGFPFFTLGGLFFGAIWAKHAWGRYWGWDPKETFTLVTWLVYVLYLHVRIRRGWRERRAAWLAVIGFLLALFTFAGVNYIIRGLHSYV